MKVGHEFSKEHGFTGSHSNSDDYRPTIHGYKHGGMPTESSAEESGEHMKHGTHPKHDGHHKVDEHGFHIHKGHKK